MTQDMLERGTIDRLVAMMEDRMGDVLPAKRADLRIVRPLTAAERANEAWQWHDNHQASTNATDIDQSDRARDVREINRIAMRHGWGMAVSQAVDRAGATSLSAMDDDSIKRLAKHMRHLVDCAATGCDPDDAFPVL